MSDWQGGNHLTSLFMVMWQTHLSLSRVVLVFLLLGWCMIGGGRYLYVVVTIPSCTPEAP